MQLVALQKQVESLIVAHQEKKRRYESERVRYLTAVVHIVDEVSKHQAAVLAKTTALLNHTLEKKRALEEMPYYAAIIKSAQ